MLRGTLILVPYRDNKDRFVAIKCNKGRGIILPGGKVEDGETYHEGITRELKEEAGLSSIHSPPKFFFSIPNVDPASDKLYNVACFVSRYANLEIESVIGKTFDAGEVVLATRAELLQSKFGSAYACMFDVYDLIEDICEELK